MLARAYLPDEDGHEAAIGLLEDQETLLVTGTWSRIEVSGALVRAARSGRGDVHDLLAVLDGDLGPDGPIAVLAADQADTEERALSIVRTYGLRAMDAWHLATALLTVPALAGTGERVAFASRGDAQAGVAESLGLERW